ncbi:hypothetical protein C8J57DRAFT_1246753 [Mycena rebaudengoi]|nr:hypothetical protein C8J57DRAFT_1246753 [Mycena rebaudengoi]
MATMILSFLCRRCPPRPTIISGTVSVPLDARGNALVPLKSSLRLQVVARRYPPPSILVKPHPSVTRPSCCCVASTKAIEVNKPVASGRTTAQTPCAVAADLLHSLLHWMLPALSTGTMPGVSAVLQGRGWQLGWTGTQKIRIIRKNPPLAFIGDKNRITRLLEYRFAAHPVICVADVNSDATSIVSPDILHAAWPIRGANPNNRRQNRGLYRYRQKVGSADMTSSTIIRDEGDHEHAGRKKVMTRDISSGEETRLTRRQQQQQARRLSCKLLDRNCAARSLAAGTYNRLNHPRLDSDEVYREGDGAGKTPKQRNARLENLASFGQDGASCMWGNFPWARSWLGYGARGRTKDDDPNILDQNNYYKSRKENKRGDADGSLGGAGQQLESQSARSPSETVYLGDPEEQRQKDGVSQELRKKWRQKNVEKRTKVPRDAPPWEWMCAECTRCWCEARRVERRMRGSWACSGRRDASAGETKMGNDLGKSPDASVHVEFAPGVYGEDAARGRPGSLVTGLLMGWCTRRRPRGRESSSER